MNYYQAYRTPNDVVPAMVRQGFYWRLMILGPIGLLLTRCWISFALSACLNLILVHFAGPYGWLAAWGVNLALALFGAEVIGWEKRLKGSVSEGLWLGRSEADAQLRFSDRMQVSS
ncbi:hypothetical protein ABHV46_00855 [Asaia sp. BMEF1]|uniref:hypothetical protein n=1 Tax=Asaia sp. BMEF1 TaxID=3155932 RepID=UPI003F67E3FE